MGRISHHIIPSNGGWNVKKGGAERASKHFLRKEDAIRYGREISTNSGSELYIHKKDGTILRKDSYGNDSSSARPRR